MDPRLQTLQTTLEKKKKRSFLHTSANFSCPSIAKVNNLFINFCLLLVDSLIPVQYIDWLTDWFIDWFSNGFIHSLTIWWLNWLIESFIMLSLMTDWLINLSFDWLIHSQYSVEFTDRLIDWLIHWFKFWWND